MGKTLDPGPLSGRDPVFNENHFQGTGMTKDKMKSTIRFLIPIGVMMLIVLGIGQFVVFRLHSRHMERDVRIRGNGARTFFEQSLDRDAKRMIGMIHFLQNDRELREAWRVRNRDALQRRAASILENNLVDLGITRFSFIGGNNTCFLRAHNPPRRGDEITRDSLTRAARTGRLSRGLEPDPSGVLTLRVVLPWWIEGQQDGYIELGERIDPIASRIEKIFNASVALTMEKKYLDRAEWNERLKRERQKGDWDRFADVVVSGPSARALAGGMASAFEALRKKPDGAPVELKMNSRVHRGSSFPLLDAGERRVGGVSVFVDMTKTVTGRDHMAGALAAVCLGVGGALFLFFHFYNGRVERRLDEANDRARGEITERERLVRKVKTQERMAALGQLTATAAHEIRNPLATVRVALYTIGRRGRGKGLKVGRTLDIAMRNISRGDRIIQELLDYTRTTEPRMETVDIDRWLEQILDELAEFEPVAIHRRLRSNTAARIDPERLQRCVANIVGNAMEAMAPGSGDPPPGRTPDFQTMLNASTRVVGDRIELRFVDAGPGMSPEEIQKAFEPLYSTKSRGVGLGLPATRRVMEQLGGGVHISSEEGAGVTATLWLPVAR